jgi:hypothetical protein
MTSRRLKNTRNSSSRSSHHIRQRLAYNESQERNILTHEALFSRTFFALENFTGKFLRLKNFRTVFFRLQNILRPFFFRVKKFCAGKFLGTKNIFRENFPNSLRPITTETAGFLSFFLAMKPENFRAEKFPSRIFLVQIFLPRIFCTYKKFLKNFYA